MKPDQPNCWARANVRIAPARRILRIIPSADDHPGADNPPNLYARLGAVLPIYPCKTKVAATAMRQRDMVGLSKSYDAALVAESGHDIETVDIGGEQNVGTKAALDEVATALTTFEPLRQWKPRRIP